MAAWRYEISLLLLKKYFTRSLRSLVKYFSTLEEKWRGHVISSMYSCSFRVTDAPYTTTIDLMNIDECNCLIFGLSFLNARGVACGLTTHTI